MTAALLAFLVPALLLAAPAPDLAITIDDGVAEAQAGATLSYTITVENRGSAPFEGQITLELPAIATAQGDDQFAVELEPGQSTEVTATVVVADDVGDEYQVVVLAGVSSASDPNETLVRAADADAIPGADAPPAVEGLTEPDASPNLTPFIVAGAALLALALILFAVVLVRRRSRPSS